MRMRADDDKCQTKDVRSLRCIGSKIRVYVS